MIQMLRSGVLGISWLVLLGCSASEATGGQRQTGGSGGEADTSTCEDELSTATKLVDAGSSCEEASDCQLLLTESGTLSEELGNNQSGYVIVHPDADADAIQRAARELSACEGGLGPSNAGLDESKVTCRNERCAYVPM